jgi:diacylglycerol kinase family enzyme
MKRRGAAFAALALGVVATASIAFVAIVDFPRGTISVALLGAALVAGWHGLVRRGAVRVAAFGTGVALCGAVAALLVAHHPWLGLGAFASLGLALAAASLAFRMHVPLPPAPRPSRPVLVWNPHSGGGKAQRRHLPEEARARGIEPVELRPGTDLEALVRAALERGADAVAMAGGDGSQATVARLAAEHRVPFACIPAGTRNHFALDLGVEREDVVGALDAFVDGGERVIDLGEVNGRVFVNNVSLGLYGEAVQRAGYRAAKLRTLLETLPDAAQRSAPATFRWRSPDGREHAGAAAVIVSTNPYRLGHVLGDGTRPRLDTGLLGVAVLAAPGDEPGARTWAAPSFVVDGPAPVPVGIDGEAVVLEPPLRFRIRRAALRCRVARHHPGASPAAWAPESPWAAIGMLAAIAAGHEPRSRGGSSRAAHESALFSGGVCERPGHAHERRRPEREQGRR